MKRSLTSEVNEFLCIQSFQFIITMCWVHYQYLVPVFTVQNRFAALSFTISQWHWQFVVTTTFGANSLLLMRIRLFLHFRSPFPHFFSWKIPKTILWIPIKSQTSKYRNHRPSAHWVNLGRTFKSKTMRRTSCISLTFRKCVSRNRACLVWTKPVEDPF